MYGKKAAAVALRNLRQAEMSQPEHYLTVLTRLVWLNWFALAVMLALFFWLQGSSELGRHFPGYVQQMFVVIALEYGLINFCLTLALHFRDWYERTPRRALNLLQQLTLWVLVWDGLHALGSFFVFGGVAGPLAALPSVLVLIGFVLVPLRQAAVFAAGMLLAVCAIVGLQISGWLGPQGLVGEAFQQLPASLPMWLTLVLAQALPLIGVGLGLQGRLFTAESGKGAFRLLDARFGCFSRPAFDRRLAEELGRGRRHKASTSLLLLQLHDCPSLVAGRNLDGLEVLLHTLADVVREHTRMELDTCAYLGNACFALLLPTADHAGSDIVCQRIVKAFAELEPQLTLRRAAVTHGPEDPPLLADAFIEAARGQLQA